MILLWALFPLIALSQENPYNFSTVNIYIKQQIMNETFIKSTINYRSLSQGMEFLIMFMSSEDSFYCSKVIFWLYSGDNHVFPEGVAEINIPDKQLTLSSWNGEETLFKLGEIGDLADVEWNNNNDLNSFSFYNGIQLEFHGIRFILRNVSENLEGYCLFYNNFTSFSLRKTEICWDKSSSFYIVLFLLSSEQITIEDLIITERK